MDDSEEAKGDTRNALRSWTPEPVRPQAAYTTTSSTTSSPSPSCGFLLTRSHPTKTPNSLTLKDLLSDDLKGQKVIVFTYYRDTARYLYRELAGEQGAVLPQTQAGEPTDPSNGRWGLSRLNAPASFRPLRHSQTTGLTWSDPDDEKLTCSFPLTCCQRDRIFRTAEVLVNYDLHWNPTRMVQRAGTYRPYRIKASSNCFGYTTCSPRRAWNGFSTWWTSLSRKITDYRPHRISRRVGPRRNCTP